MQFDESLNLSPAGRLWRLLDEGIRTGRETDPGLSVWGQLLGVDPKEDRALLLRRYARVLDLPTEIREEVRKVPGIGHDVYLAQMPPIETILLSSISQQWKATKDRVSGVPLQTLQFCHDVLRHNRPQVSLSGADLGRLRELAHQLRVEVVGCNLPEEAARILLSHVKALEDALDEYQLGGVEGIVAAADAALGAAIRESSSGGSTGDAGGRLALLRRLGPIVVNILTVLRLASGLAELPETIERVLPALTGNVAQEIIDAEVLEDEDDSSYQNDS